VPGGIAARLGGEEFVLILPGTGERDAHRVLEQVRTAVAAHDWRGLTQRLPVTISIGAATAPDEGLERSSLLAAADQRLYVAKRSGRNRLVTTDRRPTGHPADDVRHVRTR
jgi:diguanylate cyclase (GGDEF)-like protein